MIAEILIGAALLFTPHVGLTVLAYRWGQRRKQERGSARASHAHAVIAAEIAEERLLDSRDELTDCRELLVGDVLQALRTATEEGPR